MLIGVCMENVILHCNIQKHLDTFFLQIDILNGTLILAIA